MSDVAVFLFYISIFRYEDVNTHIKDGMGAIQALQMAAKAMLKYKGSD